MQKHSLKAEKRDLIGKRVNKLRASGNMPVGLYGKDIKSIALQVPLKEFNKIYSQVGKTGLVDLKVDDTVYPSLIKNVQLHPVSDFVLHAEFHKVNLKEKIKANVPVEIVGESPAVANQTGLLLQTLNEIEVEALPTDLPEAIQIDVTALSEIEQQITVGEIKKIPNVEFLTPPEEVVVKIAPAVSQEAQKDAEAEVAATTEASETGEATPGTETPADAPASTEEKAEVKE